VGVSTAAFPVRPTAAISPPSGVLAPRFEDSHQRIAFEVRRREIFSDVRQSDAIESGANHEFHVVTINGPLTETVNDCFPLSNSQR
jgi:hypothetical protein